MKKKIFEGKELKELVNNLDINKILKNNAYQNIPLSFEESYALGVLSLCPYNLPLREEMEIKYPHLEKQTIAALCALHNRATYQHLNSPQQIAGICASIFDHDIGRSKECFVNPKKEFVMDNCGMGGDLYRTPNVSTISAIIAASDGIPFCKHGSPGNTDSVGSSDFLKHLGFDLFLPKHLVEESVEKFNFGYTDALNTDYKLIHLQSHKSAHLAHMNDIIGPITNPLNPNLVQKRIVGINHLIPPERVAEAYIILNSRGVTNLKQGLFVRGFASSKRNGGMDEVSILPGGSIVAELKDNKITLYDLFAEDFGLNECNYEDIMPKGSKKKFSTQIIQNLISGPPKDLILANTSLIYYLARGMDLRGGVNRARQILDSGLPKELINKITNFYGGLK